MFRQIFFLTKSTKPQFITNQILRQSFCQDQDFNQISLKDIVIPHSELDIQYSRSSGAGGQHVNKTNSKAEIRLNIYQASWISDEAKQNLFKNYSNIINNKGEIIITSQESRTQQNNLKQAIKKLQQMIFEASLIQKERRYDIPPETKHMAQRRIDSKRIKSQTKKNRQGRFD